MAEIIDETLLNVIAASTVKTVRDLCQVEVTLGKPYPKGAQEQPGYAIGGVIGLASNVANGTIILGFTKEVFLGLMSKMMGEPVTTIQKENEDAAAELLNIIFGQTKAILNKRNYAIEMAIPSVVHGGEINSAYSKVHMVKVYPFTTPFGTFYLELLFNLAEQPNPDLKQKVAAPINTPAEQAAFFKPFMEGVTYTMKIQCGIECKPGKPYIRKGSGDYMFDIAGLIGITSKTLTGAFMLSFGREAFLKMVSKMFGETITEFQPGMEDAVSELVNITLGSAKAVLNNMGHGIQMATPTVLHGKAIVSALKANCQTVVVPYESNIGPFYVEVTIQPPKEPAKV